MYEHIITKMPLKKLPSTVACCHEYSFKLLNTDCFSEKMDVTYKNIELVEI